MRVLIAAGGEVALPCLHAVLDGVFDQWLQGEVGQIPAFQRTVRVQRSSWPRLNREAVRSVLLRR